MTARQRILYIDDDAGLRRLVQRALERRGFEVEPAEDADAGLARLAAGSFDLVAVDHHMPGKDGLALLREVVAMPDAPPVVFVTGSDETQVAVTALKSGAADFVVKTVGEHFFDILAVSFTQALERVSLQRGKERAEQELRDANLRLEALLGEVHHRVANSLQMVSSFVSIQAGATTDPGARAALAETQARIHAVAQVHHRLFTANAAGSVELAGYLEELATDLHSSVARSRPEVALGIAVDPVAVEPATAISVGVIVSELVTNAVKYAFPDDRPGRIEIELSCEEAGRCTIEVRDDGIGFDSSAPSQGTGLGMRIVGAMMRSLRSELETVPSERGTTFRFAVPLRDPPASA